MYRGMIEALERRIELGDAAPEILEQLGRLRRSGERLTRQECKQPHEVANVPARDGFGDRRAITRGNHSRTQRAATRDVKKCVVLCFEQSSAIGRIGDLQHEPIAAHRRLNQEVLIALAG